MGRHELGDIVGGHFTIIRLLGEGGFGETYLAKNRRRLDTLCVLKWLKATYHSREELEHARSSLKIVIRCLVEVQFTAIKH